MSERYTLADCDARLRSIVAAIRDECPDADRMFVQRESGVYRLRIHAVNPGSWESDMGPACLTAREQWLYLHGLANGLCLVDQVRMHTESDIDLLRRDGRMA